ncbi:receptor-type tyrosine-protein phosphatase F-like isoform X2 [Acropora millepora]|uniref:receptor-type tyrosine-protein phosphatase F-like isoform X2 n=1 Tax=Acropora millepora TaxID=45264 RepID=UPI001CF43484|nr:receptor-type tyrosine-protein phosphatase F-like isoform X2 [Acropora millepora]
MALVVFISSFLITSTVHDTMANETAVQVDMNCRCNSIGFKTVNINWEPLHQEPTSFFEPVYYRVFFCTYAPHMHNCDISNLNQGGHYHLGCTLNTSANLQSVSQQSKLECSISPSGDTLFDPYGFHFIVEMRNSSGVFISRKKTCRLAANECAKPQNVKVIAKGKRKLSISWNPSWEMGRFAQFLCYRIWYASSQAKKNESFQMTSHPQKLLTYTIHDLSPHTKYTLFIQCSLPSCIPSGWGPLSGPTFVLTDEEVPAKAPEFKNNNFFNISNNDDKKRDESVFWKLPARNTWNGVLRMFKIYYWQLPSKESFSNMNSDSNRSRMLQINDGSAKEATLIGLSRFDDYEAKISMCNSQGCGPNSGPLVLRGDNEGKKTNWGAATSKNTHNDLFVKMVAGTSTAIAVLFIVCVVIYKLRESRRRREIPLNEMWNSRDLNPDDVEEIEPIPSNANSYDEIGVPRIPNTSIPLLHELQIEQGSSEVDV